MRFTDETIEPFGRTLLDLSIESRLGYKTPLVFRMIKLLQTHGCLPSYGFQMCEVCLEEAIANAILHGNRRNASKQVRVQVFADEARFGVIVEDEGEGFRPQDVPDPTDPQTLYLEHGRGIMLIDHYMDSVEFAGKGRRLLMVRRRQTQPDAGALPPAKLPSGAAAPADGTIEAEAIESMPTPADSDTSVSDVTIPDELELDFEAAESVNAGPVSVREQSGATVATVHALRITEDNAAEIRVALLEAAGRTGRLVVDMSQVQFMSSVGIALLMAAFKAATAKKGTMILGGLQPALVNILDATGLRRLLKSESDVAAAVKQLTTTK